MNLLFVIIALYLGYASAYLNEIEPRLEASRLLGESVQDGGDWTSGFAQDGLLQPGANDTLASSEAFSLFKRQTRQCPGGSHPCDAASITCCYNGYDCVSTGCCPSGEVPCGATKCYNPSTMVCCSGGYACSRGYVCVGNNSCCPSGSTRCGSGNCYNSGAGEKCCSSGTVCRSGYDCVTGGCCPKGQVPCGTNRCYDPKTQVCCGDGTTCRSGYNCVSNAGSNYCCPSGETTCGSRGCYDPKTEKCCGGTGYNCPKGYDCFKEGTFCCKTGTQPCGSYKCYDPKTAICCTAGFYSWGCDPGSKCCGLGCCGAGERCGSDGLCYAPTTRPTTTRSTTRSTTSRTTTPKISTPKISTPKTTSEEPTSTTESPSSTSSSMSTTKTRPCTTPTPSSPQLTTHTIAFVYDANKVSIPKTGPYAGQRIPHTNGAVLWNMCRGISRAIGRVSNMMTLTHGGKCFTDWNRRETCTENNAAFCRNGVNEYIRMFYPNPTTQAERDAIAAALTSVGDFSCDEFPFASSVQGGDLSKGSRICVPRVDQNWQGTTLSTYFRKDVMGSLVIRPGDKYVIQIRGWNCATQAPDTSIKRSVQMEKRDAFAIEGVNFVGAEMWRGWNPQNPSARLMSMPLGDLDKGDYDVNVNTTKGAMNMTLTDYNGTPFDISASTGTDGSAGVSFSLDDTYIGVGISGVTYDQNLEVAYRAKQISTETSAAPTTTTTAPSGSVYNRPSWRILYLVWIGLSALFCWNSS